MLDSAIYMMTGKMVGKLPFPENAEVARRAAGEGIVLLKNDGTLPMNACKAALFGAGADDTAVCGTGSGYAFSPYFVSICQGLQNAGFEITSKGWLKAYRTAKTQADKKKKTGLLDKRFSGITADIDAPLLSDSDLAEASDADTAIYVIRRNTGENFDRKPEKGDYYLSDNEEANIRLLAEKFAHTVIVLNTCVIDAAVLESIPGISAIILLGQAGLEAGNALADIITGKISPSGRLTDTWAKCYEDYPAAATFSQNDGNTLEERYTEDIFVGYRHFDTLGLDVIYPFGYGLSYTEFAYENISVTADWSEVIIRLAVHNIGKNAGREIVQAYASAPEGRLQKPYQELRGYAKTNTIAPGSAEVVEIRFPTAALASYDESKAAWVMEAGDYLLRVGRHSRDTHVAAILHLDADAVTEQLSNQMQPEDPLTVTPYPARRPGTANAPVIELYAADCVTAASASMMKHEIVSYYPQGETVWSSERKYDFPVKCEERTEYVSRRPDATLLDVADGRVTMEEFVASLDRETLLRIVTGDGCETKHSVPPRLPKGKMKSVLNRTASGKTTGQYTDSLGIPAMALADGPAGLHLVGKASTAFPVGMVVAQSWNNKLVYEIGDAYGKEMEHYHITICLGPGMNIHRDPLCGRNFEYYSEDPLLTGRTAAAFTRGVQEKHPGYGVAIKHFAANNQELDRFDMNAVISERALREIYLKGFEICVKTARPLTVMSSYNCINGLHTSSRYDLLTDILRGEWGFDGFVMTDWDSHSEKPFDYHAGNDIVMGGYPTDILSAAMSGKLPVFDADGAVHQEKIAMYGGVMHKTIEAWNCFAPDKNGRDKITTWVQPGIKLPERVEEAVKNGIASVGNDTDGRITVTYSGTNRGAYLPLGDLQRSAMRVLRVIMNNAPMKLAR